MRPTEDRLHPDEPWFTMRGQDMLAPYAVQEYASLVRTAAAAGAIYDEEGRQEFSVADLRRHADEADKVAAEMIGWQSSHPDYVKLPD